MKSVTQPTVVSTPASLRIYNDSYLRYSARLASNWTCTAWNLKLECSSISLAFRRIAVRMACEMRFELYPADTQKCNIDLKSCTIRFQTWATYLIDNLYREILIELSDGYNDKQLQLSWYRDGVRFGKEIKLANFYLGLEKPAYFSFTSSSGNKAIHHFLNQLKLKWWWMSQARLIV